MKKADKNLEPELPNLEPIEPESKDDKTHKVEEPAALISFETIESPVQTEIIRQPSPPPVLAEVQDLIPSTPVAEVESGLKSSSPDGLICSEAPLELHIVRDFYALCVSLLFLSS